MYGTYFNKAYAFCYQLQPSKAITQTPQWYIPGMLVVESTQSTYIKEKKAAPIIYIYIYIYAGNVISNQPILDEVV